MVCYCDRTITCNYPITSSTNPTRCTGTCSATSIVSKNTSITQKLIWQQVRVPSSLYAMNKAALQIGCSRLNTVAGKTNNQSSDQSNPSVQNHPFPSHGNSSKTTLTSLKPGAGMPGGTGVDIKHNSYARYLGRKKATTIRTQNTTTQLRPYNGNKTQMFGLLAGSENCCSS